MMHKSAIKQIPIDIEAFLRDVSNYIYNGSGKRKTRWMKLQESLILTPLNILKIGGTRWLSVGNCVARVLTRWTALEEYFKIKKETSKDAANIYKKMSQPLLIHYLRFIFHTLEIFNTNISTVQSITPKINKPEDVMTVSLKKLLAMYMDAVYVKNTNLDFINPNSDIHNLPINKLNIGDVGELVTNDLSITQQQSYDFFINCKNYLKAVCDDLKKRVFECNNDWSMDKGFCRPENALNEDFHNENPNLSNEIDEYTELVTDDEREAIN